MADLVGVGPLGLITDLVGGALSTASAVAHFSEEGIHSDGGWDSVGGVVNSGLGLAGEALGGPAGALAVDAAQVGLDLVGAGMGAIEEDCGFSADEVVGGAVRGMVGDESIGYSAGEAITEGLGGGDLAAGVGAVAATGLNIAAAPLNMVDTATGGVVNFIGDLFDGDDEDTDYWGNFKTDVWNEITGDNDQPLVTAEMEERWAARQEMLAAAAE